VRTGRSVTTVDREHGSSPILRRRVQIEYVGDSPVRKELQEKAFKVASPTGFEPVLAP